MSQTLFVGRRILVIGDGLVHVAEEGLRDSILEFAGPERLLLDDGGLTPDLVIIDAQAGTAAAVSSAIEALARRRNGTPAILVGEGLPTAAVRALLRLERSDVLEAPFSAADLARAAGELIHGKMTPTQAANSRCWAVMGAVGGAGATTIAVELASALAVEGRHKKRVCLVDLNLADGAAAAYLGATPNMLLSQTASSPERIDAALLDVFAARISDRLDLVAAPRDPRAFELARPETVLRVLELACQIYDWVIVDVPRQRQSWTLDVLAGSDELVVVSELTVPALIAARSLANELETDLPAGPTPRIVLNRLASRVLGPAPSMTEAERALGRKADGAVTSDWEAAAASVNLGGSIRQHRPKSKIVRDIEALAQSLARTPEKKPDTRAA